MGAGVRLVCKPVLVFGADVGDAKQLHGLDPLLRTTSAQKTGHGPDGQVGGLARVSVVGAL